MAGHKTLMIIKPDAVKRHDMGYILTRVEAAGFTIRRLEMKQLSELEAKDFYKVHAERPFYNSLVSFMTSGPVVVGWLERDNAVESWRQLIGATNPADAAVGTIRADIAESLEANSVHGSDSDENAEVELNFFFGEKKFSFERLIKKFVKG
ncbi:MAG TPA: nucleoside-diphosphate kinase [candidate division Zixibacteria bacterium]|nr:nucleoside-diphosphate kinase [candidate division Zixibacteria bacterium]